MEEDRGAVAEALKSLLGVFVDLGTMSGGTQL